MACLMGLVTRMWPAVAIAITGFWLWSAANWTDPNVPEGWQGVDLQIGSSQGRDARIQAHRDLIATVKARASGSIWNVDAESKALGQGSAKHGYFRGRWRRHGRCGWIRQCARHALR